MGVKAEKTWTLYSRDFAKFLEALKMGPDELAAKAQADRKWFEQQAVDFLWGFRQKAEAREISMSRVWNYLRGMKCFCEMNDVLVNWRKIERTLPAARKHGEDRPYTREELLKLLKAPDPRVHVMVLFGASSGIRFGAWSWMKWKHVQPVERSGKVVAAKLTVYAGEPEEYIAFVTPEAYRAAKSYMDFRDVHGEPIGPESPLLRNRFLVSVREATVEETQRQKAKYDPALDQKGTPHRLARDVRPLDLNAARHVLIRAAWRAGLRLDPKKRHDTQITHGFRKYFKTHAEQVMKPANVEICMGHSLGVSDSYYKVTWEQLLEDYLKAVPGLTVDPREPEAQPDGLEREKRLDEQLEAKDREIQRLSTVMQTVLRDVAELRSKLVQAEETLGPDDGGELVPGGRIGAEDQ
jgi:integrase